MKDFLVSAKNSFSILPFLAEKEAQTCLISRFCGDLFHAADQRCRQFLNLSSAQQFSIQNSTASQNSQKSHQSTDLRQRQQLHQ